MQQKIRHLVDAIFDEKYSTPGLQRNPVTGGAWFRGQDSVQKQKKPVRKAFEARALFAVFGPPDCQPLPISEEERKASADKSKLGCILAAYSSMLADQGYEWNCLPKFKTFAAGLLGHPRYGKPLLEGDPSLALRYPPEPPDENRWRYSVYWCC